MGIAQIKNHKAEIDKCYALENMYNQLIIRGYDVINDNYPKYVITTDKMEYDYNGIKHINIIDFLLDDNF